MRPKIEPTEQKCWTDMQPLNNLWRETVWAVVYPAVCWSAVSSRTLRPATRILPRCKRRCCTARNGRPTGAGRPAAAGRARRGDGRRRPRRRPAAGGRSRRRAGPGRRRGAAAGGAPRHWTAATPRARATYAVRRRRCRRWHSTTSGSGTTASKQVRN